MEPVALVIHCESREIYPTWACDRGSRYVPCCGCWREWILLRRGDRAAGHAQL